MKEIKHLIRGGFLALIVIIGFTVIRNIVVPESFGKYGYYRAEAVTDEMSREPLYQGADTCKKCHEPRHKEWSSGKHGGVNCEDCHGAAREHVTQTTSATDTVTGKKTIPVNRTNELCLQCHLQLSGRPDKSAPIPQPQIDLEKHMKGKGNLTCFKCHNPHHPDLKPPEPVETPADSNVAGTSTTTTDEKKTVSAKGRSVYNDKCLACHGAKGDGKTEVAENLDPKPPNFARLKIGSSQLVGFITNGKGEQMLAYKDELSGEEIKEVAGFVEGFRK